MSNIQKEIEKKKIEKQSKGSEQKGKEEITENSGIAHVTPL